MTNRSTPSTLLMACLCLLLSACTPINPTELPDTPIFTQPPAPTADVLAPTDAAVTARVADIEWSPSGEALAYTSNLGAVYAAGPNGEQSWPVYALENCQPCDPQLDWSPDGSHLLVTARGMPGDQSGMWIVSLESEERTVLEPFQSTYPLIAEWHPDGGAVAFLRDGEAWVYNLETGQSAQVTDLRQNPVIESIAPYDRVSGFAWSPDGSRIALEVTGNFPSPYSGILMLDLSTGRLRILANGGQSPIWAPDGERVAFQNSLGDFSATSTVDSYGVSITNGDIFNLTRSNPEYDPFFQSADGYLPSSYQTGLVQWSPTGSYLYPTLTFPTGYPMGERGPEQGFIVRSDPSTMMAEHLGTADRWYIFPTWLQDGSFAYLTAQPSNSTAWEYQLEAAFIGETQAWEGDDTIRTAAWSPDGSRLAIVLAGAERTLFNQIQVIYPRMQQ